MSLHISSPVFNEGGNIPLEYTKDGQNVSPALRWTGNPAKTLSLVLILHDPDAPVPGGFTHWVVFNLPPDSNGLTEGVVRRERLEDGTLQGKNDSGAACYMGPAPPPGKPHHYRFKLYAVDKTLNLTPAAGRKEVLDAIKGHILDESETTGLYQR